VLRSCRTEWWPRPEVIVHALRVRSAAMQRERPLLLVVVAHPDDETFGTGSVIANAAVRGVRVVVCCATRGEAGEDTSGTTSGPAELAVVREGELRAAAKVLGADEVVLLDFADSGLHGDMPPNALAAVDLEDVITPIASLIEERRPDVVVTLDPDSVNDHRDHMRIGEAATIAFARAATPAARLYHWTLSKPMMDRWLAAMKAQGLLEEYIDLELGRPEDEITTVVDVAHVMETRRAGIAEHRTQLSPFTGLSPELERTILSRDFFVRAVPAWEGGPKETDLFDDGALA
jgi:LmbE family N-acetylglucosaminyl deacetylase